MKKCFAILLVALLAATVAAQACRYTVRDVGFADLGNERYTFLCFVDDQVPSARVEQLGQAAAVLFSDANVWFQLVNLAKGEHPQAKRLAKRKPGVPAGLLLSPDGELAWTLNFPATKPDNPEWSFLASVVSSPARDELIKKLIPAYAVILFVEGTDAAQTKRARSAVDDAIKAITTPVIEVHISNPAAREPFRHHSFIASAAKGSICGFGTYGYVMALDAAAQF